MNILLTILIASAISVGSSFGIIKSVEAPKPSQTLTPEMTAYIDGYIEDSLKDDSVLGAVLPIAGMTYNLSGSGVSSSATSITLQSLTLPQTGQEISDSDLSDTFYITLEPGNRAKQEIVSCTTVTQNANDTATLSGCSRGLSPISPYTASTTLAFVHGGSSQVIFSDPPQLFNQYAAKSNNETITGQWTFSTFPITPNNGTSTETVAGVVELATGAEAAASTLTGGTTARLVLPTSIATSTWSAGMAGNVIPVTDLTTKRIHSDFIATSTLFTNATFATTTKIGAFPAWHIGKQMMVVTVNGTSTISVPSGITKLSVELVGAGGVGGACSNQASNEGGNGGGGGGGGYSFEQVDVTGTSTIQVFVGDGGAGDPVDRRSEFGTNGFYLSATGGTNGTSEGNGGAGGVGSNGTINLSGQSGDPGQSDEATGQEQSQSGTGGSSHLGFGGAGTTGATANGNVGVLYGGGGAGGHCQSSGESASGGSGADGIVIIRW